MLKTVMLRSSLIALACALSVTAHAYAADPKRVDVPAGDLTAALEALAKQSGVELVYQTDQLKGLRTQGVTGDFSLEEAVTKLLEGTELTLKTDTSGAMLIALPRASSKPETPMPGSDSSQTPSAPQAFNNAETPDSGTAKKPGFWGRFRLAQNEPSSQTNSSSTKEQKSPQSSDKNSEGRVIDEVIVTGTHIRNIAPESSPVVTYTRQEIEDSGLTTVEQFMRTVPQNFQSGANQENFNVTNAGADVTEQGASVNLRGLGPRATLVLLNGRRFAPSGFAGSYVDISLIPLSAIQRIEILTNGASAIYGSDAVGGVVNFILRDDFDGSETSFHLGTATKGDGDQIQASQTIGGKWSRGHGLVTYEYRSEDAVLAGDRDFTIGIPATSVFIPEERRHSVFASIGQELGDRLLVDVSSSYSTRKTKRDFFLSGSPLLVSANANSDAYSIGGDLSCDFGGSWRAQLTGSYSANDAASSQIQPGGVGIENDGSFTNEIGEISVKVDGDVFTLPAGETKIAVGAQYRYEGHKSEFNAASLISAGLPPIVRNLDRGSHAIFGEALVPVVSAQNGIRGIERLELSAAARYEDYEGFGTTFDPKVGVLWSPIVGLDLRGTYDTSFRAPLLTESLGSYNAFYFPKLPFLYATPDDPSIAAGFPLELLGYNPGLQPEESETWTAGLDFRPAGIPHLMTSLNYFSVRYSERIAVPTPNITGIVGSPAFDSIIIRNPSADFVSSIIGGADIVIDFTGPGFTDGGRVPSDVSVIIDNRINNTAISETSGVDASLMYDFSSGSHRFSLELAGTYLIDFKDQLTPTSPAIESLNKPYRPSDLRIRTGANWGYRSWSSNINFSYVGDYVDDRFTPALAVDSFTIADLTIAYSFDDQGPGSLVDGMRIAFAALNLFDTDPPDVRPDPGETSGVGYDPVNASGRGRFVAIQIRKQW